MGSKILRFLHYGGMDCTHCSGMGAFTNMILIKKSYLAIHFNTSFQKRDLNFFRKFKKKITLTGSTGKYHNFMKHTTIILSEENSYQSCRLYLRRRRYSIIYDKIRHCHNNSLNVAQSSHLCFSCLNPHDFLSNRRLF